MVVFLEVTHQKYKILLFFNQPLYQGGVFASLVLVLMLFHQRINDGSKVAYYSLKQCLRLNTADLFSYPRKKGQLFLLVKILFPLRLQQLDDELDNRWTPEVLNKYFERFRREYFQRLYQKGSTSSGRW